jgi:ribose-phosphate pyrophosphokinase
MVHVALQGHGYHEEFEFQADLYSDNTPLMNVDQLYTYFEVTRVVVSVFDVMDFHAAMMLSSTIIDTYPEAQVVLFIPYFPGARQDRRNGGGDGLFALKYYADIVNSIGFDKVVVVDPHSEVTPALINNCKVWTAGTVFSLYYERGGIDDYLNVYAGVIAPDAGATKRAYDVAETLGIKKVYQAWKHRDIRTGALQGFGIEPIPNGKYLMVDDICDGGGTFVGLDNILPQKVNCDLYVTHGIFSKGIRDLSKHFGRIITTNSRGLYETNLEVINIRDWIWNNDYV